MLVKKKLQQEMKYELPALKEASGTSADNKRIPRNAEGRRTVATKQQLFQFACLGNSFRLREIGKRKSPGKINNTQLTQERGQLNVK